MKGAQTQQLGKNVYLTHEQTVRRKALESLIALYIEWRVLPSKDEILKIYLNLAENPPVYFEKMRAWTIYGLVYRNFLTLEQGKEFLRNFSAERDLDLELRTKEEFSRKKNGSPRR